MFTVLESSENQFATQGRNVEKIQTWMRMHSTVCHLVTTAIAW